MIAYWGNECFIRPSIMASYLNNIWNVSHKTTERASILFTQDVIGDQDLQYSLLLNEHVECLSQNVFYLFLKFTLKLFF